MRQLKDTENRDKYKVYGELINAYGYNVSKIDGFLANPRNQAPLRVVSTKNFANRRKETFFIC